MIQYQLTSDHCWLRMLAAGVEVLGELVHGVVVRGSTLVVQSNAEVYACTGAIYMTVSVLFDAHQRETRVFYGHTSAQQEHSFTMTELELQ
eukprot:COSAG02_NODE_9075_length_2341_cov_2.347904_3_plen_91_part_00